jgi:hypothetical protein
MANAPDCALSTTLTRRSRMTPLSRALLGGDRAGHAAGPAAFPRSATGSAAASSRALAIQGTSKDANHFTERPSRSGWRNSHVDVPHSDAPAYDSRRQSRRIGRLNYWGARLTKLRFLHLSDIHFGQERSGEVVYYNDIRDQLSADVVRQAETLGAANRILVTGDTAYSGKKAEFETAATWLDAVAAKAGCRNTAVSVIPGNHDVDLDAIDKWVQAGHRLLRSATPEAVLQELDNLTATEDGPDPLVEKLAAYREFAAQYESDFNSSKHPAWTRVFELEPPFRLRLVGLNTVLVSQKGDKYGDLVLGPQCVWNDEDDIETIALMHHPPPRWFKDELVAWRYLKQRARLLITGHEHLPQWETVRDAEGNEHCTIRSGATSPPENEAKKGIDFCYNWIEIHQEDSAQGRVLQVRVYPRAWDREKLRFDEDFHRTRGRGFLEFTMRAWHFKSTPHSLPEQPASILESARVEETPVHAPPSGPDLPSVTSDDERFARLRRFFWRHLKWQERLKTLSALELLPESLSRPVPQTIERLALEAAREKRVLFALWSAVMEYVPSELRENNPFRRGE